MNRLFIKHKIAFLLFISTTTILPQQFNKSEKDHFIDLLLKDSTGLEKIILPSEYELSKRLGISYPEVKLKFLISNDIDSLLKVELLNRDVPYEYVIDSMGEGFNKLILSIPSRSIKREYYFYNDKLVSKPYYYSRNWTLKESKYFSFHISCTDYFNDYSTQRLDVFLENIFKILDYSAKEIELLKKEKIHYFLCKDENEIEKLTDFKIRGLYYLPYDYVITTYNCHYHELLHLLINYKLKRLNLYTLPLLQEGFAVAFGGRGGYEPDVILNMGLFLVKSKFVDYNEMLTKQAFNQLDASMSYPVSGLYTKFLINRFGIKQYLKMYLKYTGTQTQIDNMIIDTTDLPTETEWNTYQNSADLFNAVKCSGIDLKNFNNKIASGADYFIYENISEYLFKLKSGVEIISKDIPVGYKSKIFKELFPNSEYNNQKYIVKVDSNEVSIYNLLTNNLLAKYVRGFSPDSEPVMFRDGFYIFTIKKELFDDEIRNENVRRLK